MRCVQIVKEPERLGANRMPAADCQPLHPVGPRAFDVVDPLVRALGESVGKDNPFLMPKAREVTGPPAQKTQL